MGEPVPGTGTRRRWFHRRGSHPHHSGVRCRHGWCSDCRTKHGRNDGNRLLRRDARRALKKELDFEV